MVALKVELVLLSLVSWGEPSPNVSTAGGILVVNLEVVRWFL